MSEREECSGCGERLSVEAPPGSGPLCATCALDWWREHACRACGGDGGRCGRWCGECAGAGVRRGRQLGLDLGDPGLFAGL